MEIKCAHTELVDTDLLVPNPRNPNKHPDEQIKLLAKIMKHQGWRSPVVVSKRSGFIVKGHGRLMAAKLNGWTQAPVDRQDYATEADEYADMVADNKIAELSETDMAMVNEDALKFPELDIDLLGIPDFDPVEIQTLEPQCDEDYIPENVEPRTKLGDIYQLGRHRLMCGDSTLIDNVEKLMEENIAELCFTSPPYSDQLDYMGNLDLDPEHIATFIRTAFGKCSYFAVNLGLQRKDGSINRYWDKYISEAESSGLKLLSWNVWDKGECGSIGNQTAMFGISHEWIFVFGENKKDLNRTVQNKSAGYLANHSAIRQKDGSIKKQKDRIVSDLSQLKTIYHCVPQKERDDINHPARFPVRFPEGYIEAMTVQGQIIYDPFLGSGTTLIAAEMTGRKCFGMELSPEYCDVIVSRWEKYTGKKAELIND
jgi:DNA modification methylase